MQLDKMKLKAVLIRKVLMMYCEKAEIVGSIRRECLEVNDIDIILIPKPGKMDDIKRICLEEWADPNAGILDGDDKKPKWGDRMATFWFKGDIHVDLYFADHHTWPTLLLIRTGSKEHNIRLCTIAKDKGMALAADGSGLYNDRLREKQIPISCEADIFEALGQDYLPPYERF